MSKKKKKKSTHSKKVIKIAEKQTNNLNNIANKIGTGSKYKERLKTAYISILLYFGMLYLAYQSYVSKPQESLAFLIAGIIVCIYNIIKAVMSIKDYEYPTQNKIIIIINSLFILIFLGWIFI